MPGQFATTHAVCMIISWKGDDCLYEDKTSTTDFSMKQSRTICLTRLQAVRHLRQLRLSANMVQAISGKSGPFFSRTLAVAPPAE